MKHAASERMRIEPWAVLLSSTLAGGLVGFLFRKSCLALTRFPDRMIGQAALYGVDIALRVALYSRLIAVFIVSFLASLYALRILDGWLRARACGLCVRVEKKAIALLSAFSLITMMQLFLYRSDAHRALLAALILAIALCGVTALLRSFSRIRGWRAPYLLLSDYRVLILSACAPPVAIVAGWVFLGGGFVFTPRHILYFLAVWALFFPSYQLVLSLARRAGIRKPRLDAALVVAGMPLLLIPLSLPLSNELQFTLSSLLPLSPRLLAGIVIAALCAVSAVLFFFACAGKIRRICPSAIVNGYYFSLVVATIFVLANHVQSWRIQTLDLFHSGESTVPTQQLWAFGKIPFVDIWSAHGIHDYFHQVLYTLVNGYRGIEMGMWAWIPYTIGVVATYFLLRRLFSPLFALLSLVLLPVESFISYDYNFIFIPALAWACVLARPSFGRCAAFWLSVFFVSAWKLSFGGAVVPAALFIAVLAPAFTPRIRWRISFSSLITITLLALSGYVALVRARGASLVDLFHLISHFFLSDAFIGGLSSVTGDRSPAFLFFYFVVFPLISSVYIIVFLLRAVRRERIAWRDYALTFIAVASLITSTRGLTRHTLAEDYFPYLFVFLGGCLPLLWSRIRREAASLFFLAIVLPYLIAFPSPTTLLTPSVFSDTPRTGRVFTFRHWRQGDQRATVADDSPYRDLLVFLNRRLQPGQTFYEFIMAPALYALSGREVPDLFFLGTMNYASDSAQAWYLRRFSGLYALRRVPFVVFSDSGWWGGRTDEISSEVRDYRIAEFIYRHYHPIGTVGTSQVWVANNYEGDLAGDPLVRPIGPVHHAPFRVGSIVRKLPWIAGIWGTREAPLSPSPAPRAVPIDPVPQGPRRGGFSLRKLPWIWGTYDAREASRKTAVLATLREGPVAVGPSKPLTLRFAPEIDKSTGNYLHLRIRSGGAGSVKLFYGGKASESSFQFDVVPSGTTQDYLVRISTQWKWMSEPVDSFTLLPTVPLELEEAFIRKGD